MHVAHRAFSLQWIITNIYVIHYSTECVSSSLTFMKPCEVGIIGTEVDTEAQSLYNNLP